MEIKKAAYDFLSGMEEVLNRRLPPPSDMRALMLDLSTEAKGPSTIRENIFLYHLLPVINEHMQTVSGIGAAEARMSLLCEYHSKVSTIASGNPFRRVGHPFSKNLGKSVEAVFQSWTQPSRAFPMNQAYPDFAFRQPFPFRIAFDAKYFVQRSQSAARKALVEGAYECMFYRGLPAIPARTSEEPDWDYEFGCLLAYDASDECALADTWAAVTCKKVFWDGANIFVMILRGPNQLP